MYREAFVSVYIGQGYSDPQPAADGDGGEVGSRADTGREVGVGQAGEVVADPMPVAAGSPAVPEPESPAGAVADVADKHVVWAKDSRKRRTRPAPVKRDKLATGDKLAAEVVSEEPGAGLERLAAPSTDAPAIAGIAPGGGLGPVSPGGVADAVNAGGGYGVGEAARAAGKTAHGVGGGNKNATRADGGGSIAWREYVSALSAHFKRRRFYPDMARRMRLTGTVRVSVRIRRDGTVLDAAVIESSGSPVLDRAALDSARGAGPVPMFPDVVTDAERTFVIPYSYRLER